MVRVSLALLAVALVGCTPIKKESVGEVDPAPKPKATEYEGGAAAYMAARRFVQDRISKDPKMDLAEWNIPESSAGVAMMRDSKDDNLYQVDVKGMRKDPEMQRTWKVVLRKGDPAWKLVRIE